MDAHLFSQGTLNMYLRLFSFTNTLVLSTGFGAKNEITPDSFNDIFKFLKSASNGFLSTDGSKSFSKGFPSDCSPSSG